MKGVMTTTEDLIKHKVILSSKCEGLRYISVLKNKINAKLIQKDIVNLLKPVHKKEM